MRREHVDGLPVDFDPIARRVRGVAKAGTPAVDRDASVGAVAVAIGPGTAFPGGAALLQRVNPGDRGFLAAVLVLDAIEPGYSAEIR